MQALQLRQERTKRGWTIEYVAEKIETTPSTIQKIETDKRKPSYEVLVKLLKLYCQPCEHIEKLFGAVET